MTANQIVSALLEGRPKKRPGVSAEPLIRAWMDSCKDEAALQKMKPRSVRAACICARQVLPKVPAKHQQVCLDAIEAAEAWAAEPSEANRLRTKEAGDAAWAAWVDGAAWAAAWAAVGAAWAAAAAGAAARAAGAAWAAKYAYEADPNINFPAHIAAKMAEYPVIESILEWDEMPPPAPEVHRSVYDPRLEVHDFAADYIENEVGRHDFLKNWTRHKQKNGDKLKEKVAAWMNYFNVDHDPQALIDYIDSNLAKRRGPWL